jgi:hypothetical protein
VLGRGPWLVRLGALGLVLGLGAGLRPGSLRANSAHELESTLSRLAKVTVSHARFEARGGMVGDFLWGRGLFFEGRSLETPNALGDIYYARIATLPSGKILAVRHVRNMTHTERADETDLAVSLRNVSYFTRATQDSLTVLERIDRAPSFEARLREYVRSGSLNIYQRTHIYPASNTTQIRIETDKSGRFSVSGSSRDNPYTLEREPWPASPWFHLSADMTRAVVGTETVARLEGLLFRATGKVSLLFGNEQKMAPTRIKSAVGPSETATTVAAFPPPSQKVHWREEHLPFSDSARLAFAADVTPSAGVAASKVKLALFDMSRLELGIVGGYREPEPDSGPPDRGHIPTDPGEFSRIVATFNGGFQSAHGKFGMKVDGRVLVRPETNLATVRIDPDSRVGFGTWNAGASADTPRAFRQNLEPLLAEGTYDPHGRGHFGDHLLASGVLTERSAMCVTHEGHLVYGWGKAIDPEALADALAQAGCVYAIHLDMNPGHCSLSYHRVRSFEPLSADSRLMTPEMRANPDRFLKWSPQDFFYLAKSLPDEPAPSHETFHGVELMQIRVYDHKLRIQGAAQDGTRAEPPRSALPGALVFSLGHKTNGSRPGLFLGGRWVVPGHRGFAALELNEQGEVLFHTTGTARDPSPGSTWVGLPALIENGKLTEAAHAVGDTRSRAALCEATPGVLLFARSSGDSSRPLAETLLQKGCKLALSLDRGSHHSAKRIDVGAAPGSELLATDQSWLVIEPARARARGYVFSGLSSGDVSAPPPASH